MRRWILIWFLAVLLAVPGQAAAEESAADGVIAHTRVDLVPEYRVIRPGQGFRVGVRMRMDSDWHVYWRNPGDSGLAPRLEWQSAGAVVRVGALHWPYPERIDAEGLTTYGYYREVVLLQELMLDSRAVVPGQIDLTVEVFWLACKVECVPGQVRLRLPMTVGERMERDPRFDTDAAGALARLPAETLPWPAQARRQGREVRLSWPAEAVLSGAEFFPLRSDLLSHTAVQDFLRDGDRQVLILQLSDLSTPDPAGTGLRLNGVLVTRPPGAGPGDGRAYGLDVPVMEVAAPSAGGEAEPAGGRRAASAGTMGVGLALVFAFAGGVILNLMPCVLPVLSIKVMNLIEHAGSRREEIWRQGLFFALGVLVMFWALAAGLIGLKALGYQAGWGFQLQHPAVVVALAALFLAIAFQLWGVVEFGQGLARLGGAARSGLGRGGRAAFSFGLMTTLCATPCTAPFMGAALGYAVLQPAATALLIFTAMGLGMAAPYLALARFPGLLRLVPRPGPWMGYMRAVFGFLLLAPIVWLGWVLGLQRGIGAVTGMYGALLLSGLGLWILGVRQRGGRAGLWLWAPAALPLILALALAVRVAGLAPAGSPVDGAAGSAGGPIPWQVYSDQAFDRAIDAGQDVFVNFTAAWCLTCRVNEQAFADPAVIAALSRPGLMAMKADWTSYDAGVTRALRRYGRNSIPLYVYHRAGAEPVILPELVTPGILLGEIGDGSP